MSNANRKHWDEKTIERELRALAEPSGVFPSCQTMRDQGRNDLACAVAKRGGPVQWAERLGLPRANSDSDFGWEGEVAFVKLCEAEGLSAERVPGVKAPWDIVIESVLRVDVKNAKLAEYGGSRGWFYRIAKKPQADIVILHQADTGSFCGIPWWICPATNITISRDGGKYAQYLNNWPLVRGMLATRAEEMSRFAADGLAVLP